MAPEPRVSILWRLFETPLLRCTRIS